jgi:hypothetical protein
MWRTKPLPGISSHLSFFNSQALLLTIFQSFKRKIRTLTFRNDLFQERNKQSIYQ